MTKKVKIIKDALENKKAGKIEVIDVIEQTSICDYFVIASCQSSVQVKACADEVEEKMEENGYNVHHTEGYRGGSWILMDYGDIIVHVMQEEAREFYDIERLWNSEENVEISE